MQHTELCGSRKGADATDRQSVAELTYAIWGSNSLDACRTYITENNLAPLFYDGLVYDRLSWVHKAKDFWRFTSHYVHPDKKDNNRQLSVGEYTWGFDTMGEDTTRFVSLATTAYAKTGETARDFKGAINVTTDGVEGVEVGVSGLKLWIRKRQKRTFISLDYVKLLSDMSQHWNNAPFLGFEAGELRFTNATGQEATDSDPEITYNFIASPNVTDLTVGDITVAEKRGHDYLWCFFENIEDDSAKATVQQPKSAYVEQVYYSADFAKFGI